MLHRGRLMKGGASCPPCWLAKSRLKQCVVHDCMQILPVQRISSTTKCCCKTEIHGKSFHSCLKTDPYYINNSEWEWKSPELLPTVSWSDVMIFMVSTPSPHTREAVKVEESPSL